MPQLWRRPVDWLVKWLRPAPVTRLVKWVPTCAWYVLPEACADAALVQSWTAV